MTCFKIKNTKKSEKMWHFEDFFSKSKFRNSKICQMKTYFFKWSLVMLGSYLHRRFSSRLISLSFLTPLIISQNLLFFWHKLKKSFAKHPKISNLTGRLFIFHTSNLIICHEVSGKEDVRAPQGGESRPPAPSLMT